MFYEKSASLSDPVKPQLAACVLLSALLCCYCAVVQDLRDEAAAVKCTRSEVGFNTNEKKTGQRLYERRVRFSSDVQRDGCTLH